MTTTHPEQTPATTTSGQPDVDESATVPTEHPPTATAADDAAVVARHTAPVAVAVRWRDVAVGAAFQAEEATAGLVTGLHRVVSRRGKWVGDLAERGAGERLRGRRRAAAAASSAVTAVATSALVDRIVDVQLERVLRPVVLAVLDDVLLLLEQEPERIQSLIRGQRESMVDELVGRIRTGAATGDTAVERLTFRVFHRGPRPAPAPPSADGT
jgi:hypothetical protein